MIALHLTLPLLLLGAATDEEEPPSPPDPKLVAEAVLDLREAFEEGDSKARVEAIERRAVVPAPEVVEWIAKGLPLAKEPLVRAASLNALRWMEHPDALETLHRTYVKAKEFRKDPELHVVILKAIGQHGDASSIEHLADYSAKDTTGPVRKARIYGLGMVREKESVERLFELMRKIGPRHAQPQMDQFRLSLVILTGDDHGGTSQEKWQSWWKDAAKKFEVAEKPPELPAAMQRTWNDFWDLEVTYERPTRRRERGGGA